MTRTAIITGASSGIGRATAIVLARQGYDVGLTWNTDEAGINATIAEVEAANRHYAVRHVDPDPGDGVQMVDELADELGHLDVFVDNAGTGASTPFLEHTLEEGRHVIDVDLTAAFLCMQTAARRLVAQGDPGRIIAVTSVHEHVPKSGSSAYPQRDHPGLPAGRPGHAEEIAHAIACLASPVASYTTGATLAVDGGLMLMAAEANSRLKE